MVVKSKERVGDVICIAITCLQLTRNKNGGAALKLEVKVDFSYISSEIHLLQTGLQFLHPESRFLRVHNLWKTAIKNFICAKSKGSRSKETYQYKFKGNLPSRTRSR
jgi:hypothetical protein